MRSAELRHLAAGLLVVASSLSSVASGQIKRQNPPKAFFRIISVGDAHVITTRKECLGLKVVIAQVSKRATREDIELSSKSISASYAKEFDLTVLFFTNRRAARKFLDGGSEEEELRMLGSIRGIYFRNGDLERIKFFPSGLTERELDDIASEER